MKKPVNILTAVLVLTGIVIAGATAYADGADRKDNIRSKGTIDYAKGTVVINASDLTYLADEIDDLEASYKINTLKALNDIGTYFKADGSVTHNGEEGNVSSQNAEDLSFANLCEGILKSQSVSHLAQQNIAAASEDNLSEGCAAWVDGNLLIGNGSDNKKNYEQGYNNGKATASVYFLGDSHIMYKIEGEDEKERVYYNIREIGIEGLDYKTLSADNFIVCPYLIKGVNKTGNSNSGVGFCNMPDNQDFITSIKKEYNPETGELLIEIPTVEAHGGISSRSGSYFYIHSEVGVYVYIVAGSIDNTYAYPYNPDKNADIHRTALGMKPFA